MCNEKMNYYAVECKCGHVGRRCYIPIVFAIKASSKSEAAKIGRSTPRCKHDHKDCIKSVEKISYEKYLEICEKNNNDPYLKCSCRQEQDLLDLDDRIEMDSHYVERQNLYYVKEESIHQCYFKKEKIKNPKKFIKYRELVKEYC